MISISKIQTGATIGMLLVFQLTRLVDQKNPRIIMMLRTGYIIAQTTSLLVYYYILKLVEKKNDKKMIDVEIPRAFFSSEEPKTERVAVKDYDKKEITNQIRSNLIGGAILVFLHLKFGFTQPLFIQTVSPIKTLLLNPLVMIHLYGMSEETHPELKRPFSDKCSGPVCGNTDASPEEKTETVKDKSE
ncbi:MAG: inorganic phosphate transporter PHO88 [Amphiamblys sp. WSBS2006]|nr:MAG: inorganic phosphate transporter PHO88 [Amphiamblys sp. WSBS2006]